jgi:DNA primase
MGFPPQFLDEIRARAPIADVVGRRVRLIRRGREHVGLCPFHKEKTPSFTVSEEKGFFHCFGCGEHGDVIGFEMRIDNLSFPEAVERLARSAGLALPERRPGDRERAKERSSLYEVLEAASAWFEGELAGTGGQGGRDYLARRGLEPDTIRGFRLGWAPDQRHALKRALTAKGISEQMLVTTGLLIVPEGGGASYDRFRGRIIFPITDRGDRVVAFGGRALGDFQPKYLNSPETPLFHKGAMLYGLHRAARAARERREVIVTEGYMDVIALHRAGFSHAVAPLGTALTETQIGELWRLAPEPVVCFDGDEAGRKAAWRAAERVLPLLRPGCSLRFAVLPPGEDPDSLIAARGAGSFAEVLAAARPLAAVVWDAETRRGPLDTPERRAALEQRLKDHARRIDDSTVRVHYEREFRDRAWEAFRGRKRAGGERRGRGEAGRFTPVAPPGDPPGDALGSGVEGITGRRERLLVMIVLNHPDLLSRVEEDLARLEITVPELDELRGAILDVALDASDLDSEALSIHLSERGFSATVDRLSTPGDWAGRRLVDRFAGQGLSLEEVERGWRHVLACHDRAVTHRAELRAAEAALAENWTTEAVARVNALVGLLDQGMNEELDFDEGGRAAGKGRRASGGP